jgi:hypothetical protein
MSASEKPSCVLTVFLTTGSAQQFAVSHDTKRRVTVAFAEGSQERRFLMWDSGKYRFAVNFAYISAISFGPLAKISGRAPEAPFQHEQIPVGHVRIWLASFAPMIVPFNPKVGSPKSSRNVVDPGNLAHLINLAEVIFDATEDSEDYREMIHLRNEDRKSYYFDPERVAMVGIRIATCEKVPLPPVLRQKEKGSPPVSEPPRRRLNRSRVTRPI